MADAGRFPSSVQYRLLKANEQKMSKKNDLQTELTKLNIAFDPSATNAELEALIPADSAVLKEPEDVINTSNLVVGDPQILRPTELPLVIKPPVGQDWLNPEQAEYAKILNAAAYANKNWPKVKDVEIARLVEIGTDPEKFYGYTGTAKDEVPSLTYKNKLLE